MKATYSNNTQRIQVSAEVRGYKITAVIAHAINDDHFEAIGETGSLPGIFTKAELVAAGVDGNLI
jgi:hypothetical protein